MVELILIYIVRRKVVQGSGPRLETWVKFAKVRGAKDSASAIT